MSDVVVAGGGYAGVLAAHRLTRYDEVKVTLINPRPFFVERIRLHQLAGGSHDAVVAYRKILGGGVRLVVDSVTRIDAAERGDHLGRRVRSAGTSRPAAHAPWLPPTRPGRFWSRCGARSKPARSTAPWQSRSATPASPASTTSATPTNSPASNPRPPSPGDDATMTATGNERIAPAVPADPAITIGGAVREESDLTIASLATLARRELTADLRRKKGAFE
ncbi:hypothetical protein ACIBKY_33200 [Nonomuraea sp. NPDC050394]|uniref:hypothetical protein n=1 Tax=Nonomuraea sp. NPDC050394 TaxID=3364363 RepID=UPI0037A51F31